MQIPRGKYWPLVIKILTVFFVIWVISFLVSDFVQVHVLKWTQTYGYPIIFLWIVLANIIAGLPSSFLPIGIGLASAKGDYNPTLAISIITIASTLGDVIAYTLTRRFRHTFLKWLSVNEHDPNYTKAYNYVSRGGGGRLVFITRFLFAGILGFVNYAAGMLKMPFWKFFWLALFGEIIWSSIWFGIGYYPLELKSIIVNNWEISLLVALCLVFAGWWWHIYLKKQNQSLLKLIWQTLIGKMN
jgi:membrane-associated protein